jgi:adenylate kinase
MFIVLIGIQGSGKGTQGDLLSKRLGIPHVSTGELLREMAHQNTPEGKHIEELIDHGVYISDEEMISILQKHVPKDVILDGFPRTLKQAFMLDEICAVDVVVHIDLHEQEAVRRALARGRADDTPEAIKLRMKQYHDQVDGILGYYKTQKKLLEINGDQSVEDVFKDLCAALNV